MSFNNEPAVGIDLGTTFSATACLDNTGRPQTLINAEGDKLTPSVVLFEGADVVVGKEAVKALATDAHQVAECAKRDLGNQFFHRPLGGRRYPPEALQAWILNKLRVDATRQIGSFSKAVVTVPAYFDEVRRKATMDAGYIAGFEVMDIINEPTAAAVAFGFQRGFMDPTNKSQERRKILVYDLGGGTFDVTVMEIGGRDFSALATDGDVMLGGKDWDQRLVDFVAEEFIRKFAVDPREDADLVTIDASHLFPSHVTWAGYPQGALLRGYMYEFLQLLAPHLNKRLVDRAGNAATAADVEALFADVEMPTYR